MALSFISNSTNVSSSTVSHLPISEAKKQKTAYHTHFLTSKALRQQQQEQSGVAVTTPPSHAKTFTGQHTIQRVQPPRTPSIKSSSTRKSEHLPRLQSPPATTFRHHSPDGLTFKRFAQVNNSKAPPASPRKIYRTNTMSTTTTMKKPQNGGGSPPVSNGVPKQSKRAASSESGRITRKFWWAPKRNDVEIRSDGSTYKHVQAKIGSLANAEYRPREAQVAIRDEPVQWRASSKVGSLANASWVPPTPRVSVRQEKLNWNAQPKIGSMNNINYKPGGGNVEIRDEKLEYDGIGPRVDCGFIE